MLAKKRGIASLLFIALTSFSAKAGASRLDQPYNCGRNIFFATKFGAAADGKTDDTNALQRAVAAAEKVNGEVFLSPGTYLHRGIDISASIALRGTGLFQTILKLLPSSERSSIRILPIHPGLYPGYAKGVVIRDLCIDGNSFGRIGSKGHGIEFPPGEQHEYGMAGMLENIKIISVAESGLYVGLGRNAGTADNVAISYCNGDGLAMSGEDWVFAGCSFGPCGGDAGLGCGVNLIAGVNNQFNQCSAFTNSAFGIRKQPSSFGFIWHGGAIQDNKKNGILIEGGSGTNDRRTSLIFDGTYMTGNSASGSNVYSDILVEKFDGQAQFNGIRHNIDDPGASRPRFLLEVIETGGQIIWSGRFDYLNHSFLERAINDSSKVLYNEGFYRDAPGMK